jgi:hypothetical protein
MSDSFPINDGPKGEQHFSQPHPLLVTFDQNFKRLEIPAFAATPRVRSPCREDCR